MNTKQVDAASGAVSQLVQEVWDYLERIGKAPHEFIGVPYFDMAKDSQITEREGYVRAVEAIAAINEVATLYGAENSDRLILQLVYDAGRVLLEAPGASAQTVVWDRFVAELNRDEWVYYGVANLRNVVLAGDEPNTSVSAYSTHPTVLEVANVRVTGRSMDYLRSIGFDDHALNALVQDWSGFGASEFVVVAETRLKKSPDNLILSAAGNMFNDAMRLIGALRLTGQGDVSIGPMWLVRGAEFNVGVGGVTRTGWSVPALPVGDPYRLDSSAAGPITELFDALRQLEEVGYGAAPGNLELALRAFMISYDSWPSSLEKRLIDVITSAEAVLGTESEITFRLAYRFAGLLGLTSDERQEIFATMKSLYETRSKIVHGGLLRSKHKALLEQVHILQDYVRRVLYGLVFLTVNPVEGFDRTFFLKQLDIALLDEVERVALQKALRLRSG